MFAMYSYAIYCIKSLHTTHCHKTIVIRHRTNIFCLMNFVYQVVYNGVNLFVLISGYFLVKTTRNTTNWEKVTKLWLSVFFYSAIIYAFSIGIYRKPLNFQELIHVLMPIRYDSYWFITQYLGLYIMSPFLAKWARSGLVFMGYKNWKAL